MKKINLKKINKPIKINQKNILIIEVIFKKFF